MIWWTALAALAQPSPLPPVPCATLARLPEAPPLIRSVPMPIGTVERSVRDAYNLPNEQISEHFAVHWGDSGGVTATEIDRLVEALELAWSVQIDDMGHPAPATSEQYFFNVYIGDSGNGAPNGFGAGGYYSPDREGYPMLVVAAGTLNSPSYADHTASHEFYHAIQGSLDRYPYEGEGAWFWEATAEWASIHTEPDNPTNGSFVFAYALLPGNAVNFFDYPDSPQLQDYYQYGAFLFPLDVDRSAGGYEVIRDAWMDQGFSDDPLKIVSNLLEDRGLAFDDVFLDHLTRVVTWDYDQGALFALTTAQAQGFYPGASMVQRDLPVAGDATVSEVGGDDAPMRYGFAAMRVQAPEDGRFEAWFEGDAEGTLGTAARYGARLVVESGATHTVVPLAYDPATHSGEATVDVSDADRLWLVVGATPPNGQPDRFDVERFPFRYRLARVDPVDTGTVDTGTPGTLDTGAPVTGLTETTEPPDGTTASGTDDAPDEASSKGGCGCQVGSGGAMGAWMVALGLVGLRRRRG